MCHRIFVLRSVSFGQGGRIAFSSRHECVICQAMLLERASRFFLLAADRARLVLALVPFWLVPSAQALRQPPSVQPLTPSSAILTSPVETRVGIFVMCRVGRLCLSDGRTLGVAAGCKACGYESASGLRDWLNGDPLREAGGINVYGF